jgi:crotonobetainyl-CoA:carnitine CoA-transferase CaiB-like acyl-CoA transferase
MGEQTTRHLPLQGVKVLELGQLIAGPFASKILGEFGADIIKVEPPGIGDPLRKWRMVEDGTSLWWHVQSRNKRSISLDLRTEEGQALARQLAAEADILIENFRPGTLEQWGMGYEALSTINPGLIMVHVSGFGQTGPYRDNPGFGVVGEAMGGLRYLTGKPGEPSVRVGVSLGDSLSGLYAVIGSLMALEERRRSGLGQEVDVSLYESVFSLMESLLPEYDAQGYVRQPSGSALPGITPSNAYRTLDDQFVLIAGNGDSIFKRLMAVIERQDLADEAELAHNDGRSKHAERIDQAIEAWTQRHPRAVILEALAKARVPAGYPYTAADIATDPHYIERGMIQTIQRSNGKTLKVPGIVPKLSATPGRLGGQGPDLGEHTDEILEALGIRASQRDSLRSQGVI